MDSRVRHIAKSITWRVIASATTFTLTLIFFGKAEIAMASWLTVAETTIKIAIYYVHERVWFKVSTKLNNKMRHIAKAITWRVIASATTFVLALLIFGGHDDAMEKATYIALIESALKLLFYYGHEEAWYRINLGLDNREKNKATS
ncbi:Predicted membrane protein [Reichenbachiella agariperforans]|uniref:Predicted membrane protein n=1 Tax=Reichenbachiella agariperforans TaxID=156994 RepID=A0A1M6NVV4_REIAG|nr:DUF2061 domain-containing protein [Reichenbachiella agariperforans]SHJ99778.1 Predicted membrane protein [Reichenbachiella agariperforans]